MKNLSPLVLTTFGQRRDRRGRKRYTHQCIIHARLVHWWVLVHVGLLGVLCAPASLVLVCYSFSKMSFEKGPLCPCLLSNWLVAPLFLIAFHGLLSISLNMISISARSSIHPSFLEPIWEDLKETRRKLGFPIGGANSCTATATNVTLYIWHLGNSEYIHDMFVLHHHLQQSEQHSERE